MAWRISTVLLFVALLLSCAGFYLEHHPIVATADFGKDTADIRASVSVCKLYGSWPIELRRGQPLVLEQRVCPPGFHYDQDDRVDMDGLRGVIGHEILLVEDRRFGRMKIAAAFFSNLEFTEVQIGKTKEGMDAVLWSYDILCGSCHGGPDGVLAWSSKRNSYNWNENWLDPLQPSLAAKLPNDTRVDDAPNLTWNPERSSLRWQESVYGADDANCCPSQGGVDANLEVTGGEIHPDKDGFFYQKAN